MLGRKIVASALAFAIAMGPSALVLADPVLVNGDFTKNSSSGTLADGSKINGSSTLLGWSTSGYNFVYLDSNKGESVSPGVAMKGVTYSGLPGGYAGNYVAADANFETGAINQTVTGLVANQFYAVSFYWATSQQTGFNVDPINAGWDVSLGGGTAQATGLGTYNTSFLGWSEETFTFKATTTGSEVLSFLATTTTSGEPPFALLADVSIATVVPEPGSVILLGLGVIGIGIARLVRRKKPVLV